MTQMTERSGLVETAKNYACKEHAMQKRKYTGEPYSVHLAEVAAIVSSVTDDENIIAAAWLHDVLEDTNVTPNELFTEFGSVVTQLVYMVSDVSRPEDGNRAARKAIDHIHLARANADAQTIKLADLISNAKDIVKNDPKFAKVYLQEKRNLLGVLTKGDSSLYGQAWFTLREAEDSLNNPKTSFQSGLVTKGITNF